MQITYQWLSTHVSEMNEKFACPELNSNPRLPAILVTPDCYCGGRGLESFSGREFFFYFRGVCQKPLVSYSHGSFIVSKAFLAQIIYILYNPLDECTLKGRQKLITWINVLTHLSKTNGVLS